MLPLILAATFSLGVKLQHQQIHYRFENPSSWDTAFLVPHFFEQRYSGTQQFLMTEVRSPRWSLEAGVTPVRNVTGSDYDTFFQPSGDVIVHGTTTPVSSRASRFATYVHGGEWRFGVAYSRDDMKFPDSISTTMHTNPPSTVSSLSTTRESTSSDAVELRGGVERSRPINDRWTIRGGIDVSPFTFARLTTHLPDKYPDHAIRFSASAFSAATNLVAQWHSGRATVAIGGELGHSWRIRKRSAFTRQQAGVSLSLGLR